MRDGNRSAGCWKLAGPIRVVAITILAGGLIASGLAEASTYASLSSCPNAPLRVGASSQLPDCRAYEQVSPTNKGGFAAIAKTALPAQVSSSGDAIAYLNYQAFPGAEGNTVFAAHVSTRDSTAWHTTELTPAVPKATVLKLYKADYIFSPDLTQSVIQVPAMPLTPEATPYIQNLFHRDSTGTYSLVNSNPPAVPAENLCEPESLATDCFSSVDISAFAGASSDFDHVLFESNAQFTETAPETGTESLYEHTGGVVRLVGILPDGHPGATSTAGAESSAFYATLFPEADGSVERAMSQDGSHVIFQAPADGGPPVPSQAGLTEVYDRIDGTNTIEISAPETGASPAVVTPEAATFQSASADGSRVFFTSSAELTSVSNTGTANNSESLYEYDMQTEQLTDLTIDTNPADASTGAIVQGVIDTSVNGAYVYVVADGQFVEGKGTDGQPNLYMIHNGGKPVFIATLGNEAQECRFIADPCIWSRFPLERQAYVTPGGTHIAFVSSRSLPTVNFPGGYDNTDQEVGQPDSEVYEYTAPTKSGGTGQLLCASCDPTGARPVGNAIMGGISPNGGEQNGKLTYGDISTPFYRVRALSEDGRRLFYAAPASLATPYDSVFEYEQDGEGTCEAPSGCQLRLSGNNTQADYFLGSSASGNDAYIATSSRLASTDTDELPDVYDVLVDGGIPVPATSTCEVSCYQPGTAPSITPPESHTAGISGNLPTAPAKPGTHARMKCKKNFRLSRGKCVKIKKKPKKRRRHDSAPSASTHASERARR